MFEMCALSKFRPAARYKVFSWRHFEWNRRGDVESQALAAPCSAGLTFLSLESEFDDLIEFSRII